LSIYCAEPAQETIFHFVRDYETVKVEQEVLNEFMLVIEETGESCPKGAYYKNIERKMLLKKKRTNVCSPLRFSFLY
jgi:RNA polymerase II-associated factor 1